MCETLDHVQHVTDILKEKYRKFDKVIQVFGIDVKEITDREALLGVIVLAHESMESSRMMHDQDIRMRNMFDEVRKLRG